MPRPAPVLETFLVRSQTGVRSILFTGERVSMWDTFGIWLGRILTGMAVVGCTGLLITIPACAYKLFSVLWTEDKK